MPLDSPIRVYCAGPLFNDPELDEMRRIADAFEGRPGQFETFLPQRDGLELLPSHSGGEHLARANLQESSGLRHHLAGETKSAELAELRLTQAIFAFDVYKLLGWSDVAVVNLNGRVPDEGTVVEAALAWHAHKAIVLYKHDVRSPFDGCDNPMLVGLGTFRVAESIDALPDCVLALESEIERNRQAAAAATAGLPERVRQCLAIGEQIVQARTKYSGPDGACNDPAALAREIERAVSSSPWASA